ncbi:ras GTPase-activating protein-binding protein 2 [Chironomus tepperi]|uniref:ras GTPase-activating protein-binding protein 2 n=1 Tax=Chironomus tepperi TaxID=113505 RepID=UPI00391F62C5
MVMEAKPSPLVVGREFVRQYYTLLHNSPDHLHRFYNQHSSFSHSGLVPDKDDGLVIGQKNIHDKIQQMNFRDCHAKISHVDAQATLGDGVVVQVFGELSNDGHQMRRFTQTFVLACQSPKKYYVHNDIFRYHDIYSEEDEIREDQAPIDVVEPIVVASPNNVANNSSNNSETSPTTTTMIVQPNVYYPAPANVIPVNPTQIVAATFVQAPQVNGVMHEEMLKNMATQTSQTPQILPPAQVQPQVMTIPIAPAPTALPIPVEPVAQPQQPQIPVTAEVIPIVQSAPAVIEAVNQYDADQSNGEESDTLDNSKETDPTSSEEPIQQKPTAISPIPPTTTQLPPKNWANLVKAGPQIGYAQPEIPVNPQPQSFVSITQQQQQQAQQQKQAEVYPERRPMRDQRERRVSNNNDGSCQLFLGNLPTNATEDELKQLFSVFGKIADLRIHAKPAQKGGNRPVPNYGFITFDDPASAQRLQDAQPIYYPVLNDKSGQKLNIEQKIRKNVDGQNTGGMNRSSTNGQNMDRGRNNNPSSGMNRNGSGGRSDRRDDRGGNRQFNRSDRMGPRPTNGNSGTTFTNSRR